jgi:hypothetical protein
MVLVCLSANVAGLAQAADLSKIADPGVWRIHNRQAQLVKEGERTFVRFDSRNDYGVAWLLGSDFSEGTIDVELRGKNDPGRSFIGIAFRGADDKSFDVVYFRPFNFKNQDPARRLRAVQYVSWPSFTWEKLRQESPGKYEQPVSPAPDPDGWFRARIVIENRKVSVFVNDALRPSLVVTPLSDRRGGRVGLWVDTTSVGDFANLKLTPRRR